MSTKIKQKNHKQKIALIGCGKMGSLWDEGIVYGAPLTHAKSIVYNNDKLSFIGVFDIDKKRAATAASHWKTKSFKNLKDVLKEKPDIVVLSTNEKNRVPTIQKIIKSKVPVILCEKPLGLSSKDVKKILNLQKKTKAKNKTEILVNNIRLFNPEVQNLKKLIQSQKLGSVQSVECNYTKGLLNNGFHMVSLLNFLFQKAKSCQFISSDNAKPANLETISAIVYYGNKKNQFPVYLRGSNYKNFSIFEMDIIFSGGRIRIVNNFDKMEVYKAKADSTYKGYRSLQKPVLRDMGFQRVMLDVYKTAIDISAGKVTTNPSTVESALHDIQVIEGIFKSKKQKGKKVSFS